MSDKHLIEVTKDDVERRFYRIICPGGGANCECWSECGQEHRCDCGPHNCDNDCDSGCEGDHALECDEWLWRDGMLHGDFHQHVGSMVCVRTPGCWMTDWAIEFDEVSPVFAPGLYEFDYDEPDPDEGGLLYITAMRAISLA